MSTPRNKLRELAADCQVRIGIDISGAPDEGGSGVWVAPGTVLTCAHVVPSGPHSKVEIGWNAHILTGTVHDQVPSATESGLWPYPDLAIIVVDDAPQHHCAWLSESPPGRELVAFGHSGELHEGLRPGQRLGYLGGTQNFGEGKIWQFKGNQLEPGMSGAPVLDLDGGAVCGIVSMAIGQDADRGGYMVPIDSLRHFGSQRRQNLFSAHDRFHRNDPCWAGLRAQLPIPLGSVRCPISPSEEMELLGFLTEFSAVGPEQLFSLVSLSASDVRIPVLPETLRDVLYILLDSGATDSEVRMSILRMAHNLVVTERAAHQDFHDWATAFAERYKLFNNLSELRTRSVSAETRRGVITVEIAPGLNIIDHFRLTVSVERYQHERQHIYQDQDPIHTLDQIKRIACDQIRIALGRLAGDASVEFVIPIELFNEPFDELVPTKLYTNLGRKHCVILRDYDRQHDPLVQYDWHRRWRQFQDSVHDIRWVCCNETLTQEEFSAELEQNPETAVLALTRKPDSSRMISDMMKVALDSGVPVIVWSRETCAEYDDDPAKTTCAGQRFQTAITPFLSTPTISNLPEEVRKLRNESALKSPPQRALDCRGTILLWDDPSRITDSANRIKEPLYQPLEENL